MEYHAPQEIQRHIRPTTPWVPGWIIFGTGCALALGTCIYQFHQSSKDYALKQQQRVVADVNDVNIADIVTPNENILLR